MSAETSYWRFLALAGGLLLAAGAGFVVARMNPPAPPPQAVNNAAAAEPSEVKVDASYLAVVGIATETVAPGNLSVDVLAPGTVTAAPNGEAVVTAHAAGTIVRLAKQLGDAVGVGETVAVVESREAASMAADRTVAESKAALARSALAREQELYNQRVTPRQDLERVQAELAVADAEVRRARDAAAASHVTPDGRIAVTSPLAGKITATRAALGSFVQPDTELFRIADPRFIQVEASVTAIDAGRISVGDPAKVATPAGATLSATVRSVAPIVNEQTRAATVVLSLLGNHGTLSPGEAVQATITPKNASPAGFVVPEDAVQNVGGRNVVFVRTATGFKIQPVVVGSRGSGRISITSGLNPGETIATTNAFFLKAELGKGAGGEE
jgi:cobalt-zinc-cadmium efflux system membrane fusion protein